MQNKVVVLSETKTKYGADVVCLFFTPTRLAEKKLLDRKTILFILS